MLVPKPESRGIHQSCMLALRSGLGDLLHPSEDPAFHSYSLHPSPLFHSAPQPRGILRHSPACVLLDTAFLGMFWLSSNLKQNVTCSVMFSICKKLAQNFFFAI